MKNWHSLALGLLGGTLSSGVVCGGALALAGYGDPVAFLGNIVGAAATIAAGLAAWIAVKIQISRPEQRATKIVRKYARSAEASAERLMADLGALHEKYNAHKGRNPLLHGEVESALMQFRQSTKYADQAKAAYPIIDDDIEQFCITLDLAIFRLNYVDQEIGTHTSVDPALARSGAVLKAAREAVRALAETARS